jgi:hypothetical protein
MGENMRTTTKLANSDRAVSDHAYACSPDVQRPVTIDELHAVVVDLRTSEERLGELIRSAGARPTVAQLDLITHARDVLESVRWSALRLLKRFVGDTL